jgi:hypothetical protein
MALPLWAALAIATLAASLYAALLSTAWGTRISVTKTHYTVMLGVLLTLGCVALLDWRIAAICLLFFVATGLPMVARSEILDIQQRTRIEKLTQGKTK